ncbi:retrovirus-related pol polyprotein from transposon TNT 1-94 [Tanacetum coccineum]
MHDDVQPNYVVDSHADYTNDSNMIPYAQYVKDNAVPIVQSNVSFVPNDAYMMIINEMHEQTAQSVYANEQNKVVNASLTAELATYKQQVELYERRAKFKLTEREQKIEEQLRRIITDRNIKEENLKKELHSIKMQLNSTINHNRLLKRELSGDLYTTDTTDPRSDILVQRCPQDESRSSQRADPSFKTNQSIDGVPSQYTCNVCPQGASNKKSREKGFEQIKECYLTEVIPFFKTLKEHFNGIQKALTKEIKEMKEIFEELEAEVDQNVMNRKYAIDVEPIPPRNKNNREVHLDYLKHLKESVETLREIVEEAKVERPLYRSLASSCLYTKHPQELLEYAIDTCPKDFYKRDKKHASTPLTQKKQVTFEDQCETSNNNTHKHVEKLNIQKTNVHMIPFTRVNNCTDASGSKPRSNTKKNRISPAKSVNKKKVEEHPRTNKSSLKITNRVDSSISSKDVYVVQIVLWYLDSGCSKHMMGDRSRLRNFVKKFIGTVRFGNDHFGAIMGYGDYVISDSMMFRVYYVKGLGHNLFSVRQFCDSDLKVAFRKHSCYVRDTDGVDLIKGSRGSNLYTISVEDMMKSSPICLLSKASKNKSWLWHRRLNHFNFGTINDLARKDLVRGLPRLKFEKDHLCSACQLEKSKKHTHTPKTKNTNLEVLNTLHMDLCEPMLVQTINGKKYILVIVDDYSRFTWVKFLRSKDETLEFVIKFLKQIQVGLNKTVRYIHTDNGTEFVNQVLTEYYESVGIFHQKLVPRTQQQNDVVEIQNRTLVEVARTMLIFSMAPMFLWAEAVDTAFAAYTDWDWFNIVCLFLVTGSLKVPTSLRSTGIQGLLCCSSELGFKEVHERMIVQFFDGFFSPIYERLGVEIFGLGSLTSLIFIFFVGIFASSWMGATVFWVGEWFRKRMPD